jgi:hypothetical protein
MTLIDTTFFKSTARCTLFGRKRNEYILEQLKAEPADEKLSRFKSNWLRHVTRMYNNRITKVMLNYRPNGRIRLGRPLKRLLDEAETGLSRPDT